MNEMHIPLMPPALLTLLTYARRRHPLTWRSVGEIAGMLGAVGLGCAGSYVVFWMVFGR